MRIPKNDVSSFEWKISWETTIWIHLEYPKEISNILEPNLQNPTLAGCPKQNPPALWPADIDALVKMVPSLRFRLGMREWPIITLNDSPSNPHSHPFPAWNAPVRFSELHHFWVVFWWYLEGLGRSKMIKDQNASWYSCPFTGHLATSN